VLDSTVTAPASASSFKNISFSLCFDALCNLASIVPRHIHAEGMNGDYSPMRAPV
jgi:hypothetical protein